MDRQRSVVAIWVVFVLLGTVMASCDESEELRNIERGRDNRPAIERSPKDESN